MKNNWLLSDSFAKAFITSVCFWINVSPNAKSFFVSSLQGAEMKEGVVLHKQYSGKRD